MSLTPALSLAVATGLLGSVHCAAMCGPLVVAGCSRKGREAWGYFLGRLLSYATVGAILGHLGEHALCVLPMGFVEGAATALVAATAAYRGFRIFKPTQRERLVSLGNKPAANAHVKNSLFALFGQLLPKRGLGLGLVTGVLPCGLLLPAWALAAGTASAPLGALVMAVFSIATLPGLLVTLFGGRVLGRAFTRLPAAAYGAAWCALSAWMVVRLVLVSAGKCH